MDWEILKYLGGAAAVYAAIRADLAYLRAKVESHAEDLSELRKHILKGH